MFLKLMSRKLLLCFLLEVLWLQSHIQVLILLIIFVHGVWKQPSFSFLHTAVQFSHHYLLKKLSLPYCIFLPPLCKLIDLISMSFFLGSLSCSIDLCLFLGPYHIVLVIYLGHIALEYILKPGIILLPGLFFSLKIALACIHTLSFPISVLFCFLLNIYLQIILILFVYLQAFIPGTLSILSTITYLVLNTVSK